MNWLVYSTAMDMRSNITKIRERVKKACERSGRSVNDVTLVAVSKKFGIDNIKQAFDLGIRDFGENYAQEFRDKSRIIGEEYNREIKWHFIGTLQRNKVKYVVGNAHLFHSLHSLKIAEEFNKRAGKLGVNTDALIEVNISGEGNKSGVKPVKLKKLLDSVNDLKNVNIIGLMGMAPYLDKQEKSRPYFKMLRELRDEMQQFNSGLKELSMGMSGDFEVAVEEGATIIRIGSSIFGERPE